MLFESIPAFLTSLRQTSPVIFSGLAIATGIILFAPPEFAVTVGIDALRTDHRVLIGLAFIVSVSILATTAIWGFIKWRKKARKQRKAIEVRENYLHELTADEKAYLAPYILDGENTQYFKMGDGVAGGLIKKNILYRPSNMGNVLTGFAYNIQPWAKEHLQVFPFLLDGASENPSGPPDSFFSSSSRSWRV